MHSCGCSLKNRTLLTLIVIALFVMLQSAAMASSVTVDCSGQTPGAFTSIQGAVNSLDVTGPHQVFIIPGKPCSGNIQITDRQRLAIFSGNGTAPISSAAGVGGDVITIQGSTGIFLGNLDISGGNRGIVIFRNSEVTIEGSSVFGNQNAGIRMDGHSSLFLTGNIHNNGGTGVNMFDSLITVVNSQFSGNGGTGVFLTRSRGFFQGATISNNSQGISFINGSSGQFTAPNLIQNNTSIGMSVGEGSSVRMLGVLTNPPQLNVIEGNPLVGLNIFSGQVLMFNGNIIRNNGTGGDPFNAGIRVDDNAVLLTEGSGDIQVTGNTGPGIDATMGGDVDLNGTVVTNNTGDGIRGLGNVHIGFFPPNTNSISGNGGTSISCDASSVFVGDRTGIKDVRCEISPVITPGAKSRHQRMSEGERDN